MGLVNRMARLVWNVKERGLIPKDKAGGRSESFIRQPGHFSDQRSGGGPENGVPPSRKERFEGLRSFADCDPAPSSSLVLKIAETREELEACFKVLHEAYVDSGFMKPHPSGMRVTLYHALPTTTTLCAKYDGEVVGTLSLIRESAMGFPLQEIFDLAPLREHEGNIAEVSALAIRRDFQKRGGILFPLMKFMYEYCTTCFDTRHVVIAVNPSHIKMYESLLLFRRLAAKVVEHYDFVNGAPAVGATCDLKALPELYFKHYASKPPRRNLYAYLTQIKLPNIQFPRRRFFTTNDPVMTPELLDYFFNIRTNTFANLSERKKALLHTIYDLPQYRAVLPARSFNTEQNPVRQHPRFSVRCPGELVRIGAGGQADKIPMRVIEVSIDSFQAVTSTALPLSRWYRTEIRLGAGDGSFLTAFALRVKRNDARSIYVFRIDRPDVAWRKFVSALYGSTIHGELNEATRFLD